jgi:hypothetical protein
MNYSIVDMETDSLDSTKIHCMSVNQFRNGISTSFTMYKYEEMINFLLNEEIIIGHNYVQFDKPEAEKVLGIKITARIIDTLALSWYLFPMQPKHGLAEWGEFFGVPKPVIKDWQNLTPEEYGYRCSEDVKINTKLFEHFVKYLKAIYGDMGIDRIMDYLTWKMDCAREQGQMKWKVDKLACKQGLAALQEEEAKRYDALLQGIPDNILYKTAQRPKNPFKKDGTPSEAGKRWFEILDDLGLPPDYNQPIKVVAGTEKGNPGSHTQLKRWLDSLGWEPQTFKWTKDEVHNLVKKIPQISNSDGTGVCNSIKALYEKEPVLENLDGLFVIRHRIGLLKGFLREMDENSMVRAEIAGFTNTLRYMHKTVVNLPKVSKPYGKLVRGCLIAPDDDHVLCGSDMTSLEDTTKQHYMYYFDPEYVKQMRVPGFDPHLSIAVFAGMITEEDSDFYKRIDKVEDKKTVDSNDLARYAKIKKIRGDAKVVNFSAVYGVGAAKMALTTGWSVAKCKKLLEAYWKLNKAVKMVAASCTVKTINNQMWIFNPVSQFWYSLRFENQGTGVYCFDMNIQNIRKRGIQICGQFHDEHIEPVRKGREEQHRALLQEAIDETNERLKLNVPLGISVDFGHSYADIH